MKTCHARAVGGARGHAAGFTLIELLVVISIIAVLISLLMPSLAKARDTAKTLKCQAGARGTLFAVRAYATDNREGLVRSKGTVPYAAVLIAGGYTNRDAFSNRGGCPYGPNDANTRMDWIGNDYYTGPDNSAADYRAGTYPQSISYGLNGILQSGYGARSPYVSPYYDFQKGLYSFNSKRLQYNPSKAAIITCCVTPWHDATPDVNYAMMHTLGIETYYNIGVAALSFARHRGEFLPMAMVDGHSELVSAAAVRGYTGRWWGPQDSPMAAFSCRNYFGGVYPFE